MVDEEPAPALDPIPKPEEVPRVKYGRVYSLQCPLCLKGFVATEDQTGIEEEKSRAERFRLKPVYTPPVPVGGGEVAYIVKCPNCSQQFVAVWKTLNAKKLADGREMLRERPQSQARMGRDYLEPRRGRVGVTVEAYAAEVQEIGNRFVREKVLREFSARGVNLPMESRGVMTFDPAAIESSAPEEERRSR